MIIGVSGKVGSGKDEVGIIIKRLTEPPMYEVFDKDRWDIRKFADALKEIASILTGIPRYEFEKTEVKNSVLGKEWTKYVDCMDLHGKCKYPDRTGILYKVAYEYRQCSCDDQYIAEIPMTVRDLLQKLGTDAIRNNLHENAWVNALMSKYTEDSLWVVTDVRFPNEAKAIKERGGILIRLNRNSDSTSTHPSETALDNYEGFDYVIDNNGSLEELEDCVKSILKEEGIL